MPVKVSVIIPVYNAEKYLSECIESLLNQTLKECEFIFVNDGSTDQSRAIIESYKEDDSRILFINQENQGVSVARNIGLKIASGEYVGFVDADDYLKRDHFQTMYEQIIKDDCDGVMTNLESEMGAQIYVSDYPFPKNTILDKHFIKHELLPYLLKKDNLNSVVNKLYRNRVIKENNLNFPEGVALGEDGLFNIRFLSHANGVKYIPYSGYRYREVAGSATRSLSKKDYFKRALEVYQLEIPEINEGINDWQRIKKLKAIKLISSILSLIHIYLTPTDDLSFRERYRYVKNMINHQDVQSALPLYQQEYENLGRYEVFILRMIHKRFMPGIVLATAYSRYRNK